MVGMRRVEESLPGAGRSRNATVPKEVLCGAGSHRKGGHPATPGPSVDARVDGTIARCRRSH